MKLSNETLTVLKNFSSINPGILFKKGSTLSTVSTTKTVLAQATLKEDFPQEFGIWDLNNFLSVVSLGKETPEIDFDDKHVFIRTLNGRSKIKYRFADKDMIVTPPEKAVVMPTKEISFTLSADDYDWIMKTANVLQSPNISIEGDKSTLKLTSYDAYVDSAHVNSIEIGQTEFDFRFTFKTENLKMIPGTYDVELSSKGIAHFKNQKEAIEYWIATEKDFSYYKG